jgi:hypothetical protein
MELETKEEVPAPVMAPDRFSIDVVKQKCGR